MTATERQTGDVPSGTGTSTSLAALRTRRTSHAGAPDESQLPGWAVAAVIAVAVMGFSVLTVLRYAARNLQADSIVQSIMSIQDVRLFYWGQDRLASVVSFLASPVADPATNLFLVLPINALAFHVLLLVVARMGTFVVSGNREWSSTLVLFLLISAVTHTAATSLAMYTLALDAQPYAMSLALALGAFLLWKRHQWWALTLAVAMVGVAVGLNPSVILAAAFLAVLEMFRRRQWIRWIVFGVVWIAWFAIWLKLSHAFPGDLGPKPDPARSYFSFSVSTFRSGATKSLTAILSAFDGVRLVVLIVIVCLSTLLLRSERHAALIRRLLLMVAFSALYLAIFAGNLWVAVNGFHVRYFSPVLVAIAVAIAAPVAAVLLTVRLPLFRGASTSSVALGVATAAAVGSIVGPLTPPSQAATILATKATADYARANNVQFVGGYYRLFWPVTFQGLDDGRTAVFGSGYRSDGDRAAYRTALDRAIASSPTPPRVLCVGDKVWKCQTYLEYLTRPGWREAAGSCPMPVLAADGPRPPPTNSCKIPEFRP